MKPLKFQNYHYVFKFQTSPAKPSPTQQPPQQPSPQRTTAVLATETTHVNLDNKRPNPNGTSSSASSVIPVVAVTNGSNSARKTSQPAVIEIPPSAVVRPNQSAVTTDNNGVEMGQMRTIELSTGRVREGFANGDVIVTLLPVNTKMPWITPPTFRPELVPEELMAQGLTVSSQSLHIAFSLSFSQIFTLIGR